jgi:hypothetical protein
MNKYFFSLNFQKHIRIKQKEKREREREKKKKNLITQQNKLNLLKK